MRLAARKHFGPVSDTGRVGTAVIKDVSGILETLEKFRYHLLGRRLVISRDVGGSLLC
jgi:hypothetical protein